MSDHRLTTRSQITNNASPNGSWFGYFYFYFGCYTADPSLAAGG
jgi:hypothetical protein